MTHRTFILRTNRAGRTGVQSKIYVAAVLLCLWVVTAGWGYPQTTGRGNITGTVSDPSGAVVVGATVTATNMATNISSSSISNRTGYFEIDSLDAATYAISVTVSGFQKLVQTGVILNSSAVVTLPLKLKVGAPTEVVTVTADAPLLNTESALNGQSLSTRELQSLTMADNDPMELVEIAPGVQSPAMIAQNYSIDGAITWNGVSKFGTAGVTNSNEFDIDGSVNQGNGRANLLSMSSDMAEQVRIDTTDFDPTSGHTFGLTVTETTKSGTNQLHGSGTYMYTDRRWAALNRFQSLTYQHQQIVDGCTNGPSTSPQCYLDENKYAWPGVHENLATFGVGGPVFIPKVYDGRNKFFFFVAGTVDDYTDASPQTASIPTVRERNGDFGDFPTATPPANYLAQFNAACPAGTPFYGQCQIYNPYAVTIVNGHPSRAPLCGNQVPASLLGLNSQMSKLINSWLPTPTNTNVTGGNYLYTVPQPQTFFQFTTREDYSFTDNDRIFFRFTRHHYTKGQPGLAPGGIDTQQGPKWAELGAIGWNHVFSATTNLDVTIGASNLETSTTYYPGYSAFPPSSVGLPSYLQQYAGSAATLPELQFGGGSTYAQGGSGANSMLFGNLNSAPSYYRTANIRANLTSIHGVHSFRAGGEWRAQNFARGIQGLSSGDYNFDTTFTRENDGSNLDCATNCNLGLPTASNYGLSYAAFLMGVQSSTSVQKQAPISISTPYFAGYFGDTWRITPKLTLMPGIRFEYEFGPKEKHDYQISEFDPTQSLAISGPANTAYATAYASASAAAQAVMPSTLTVQGGPLYAGVNDAPERQWDNNYRWLPRMGFSFRIKPSTVIRGGYGLFFDTLNATEWAGPTDQTNFTASTGVNTNSVPAYGALGFGENLVTTHPPVLDPFPTLNGAQFVSAVGAAVGNLSYAGANPTIYPHDYVPARAQRIELSVQRQFGSSLMIEVGYLGSWSTKMSNFSAGLVNGGGGGNVGKLNLAPLPASLYASGNYTNLTSNSLLSTQVANPFNIANFAALQSGSPAAYNQMAHSGTFTAAKMPISTLIRPYAFMGGLSEVVPIGQSHFHELMVTVAKRMSHGFDLNLGFQKNYQYDRDFFNNPYDKAMSWEPTNSSYPWRLTVEGIYEMPFGKGKMWANSGWKSTIFGGFRVNGTWEFSPGPLIEFGNMFYVGDIKASNILMPKPVYNTNVAGGVYNVQWLNPGSLTATVNPADGTCSYSGTGFVTNASCLPNGYNVRSFPTRLNGVRQMGVNIAMANVERTFKIREGVNLQMRFDANNLFNHQTLAGPNTTVTSTQFGQVSGTLENARWIDIQGHIRF